ncbi:MAG: MFS transporter [Bacteroides sp.]|nr:MFS transporter [Bacteroides sp.]MCM1095117.1 MFS transporter [Terasakiella sp.]
MNHIKARLSLLGFLEFAVWGSYLVSLGLFLNSVGMGAHTFWFYTVQGLVSLLMPGLIGILADRFVPAQKMFSLCHLLAGGFMIAAGCYAMQAGDAIAFGPLFTLYTISVAFFMPTIGLNNSVAFNALAKAGLDTVKAFPPIRVWGTVGFICAELLVNFVRIDGVPIMNSYTQLITSGIFSLVLCVYALTMPACPVNRAGSASLADSLGLRAFKLFKRHDMAVFFIFSMLLGVSLQITNSYGTMYIEHFKTVAEYADDFFASNSTLLISLSQCSEALCILLIPFCLRRFGIKGVMIMAMIGWVLRFGFFGLGNTSPSGVGLLMLSCIVYGVAFDFFNVSGGLYVDSQTTPEVRSSAQGLFMIMTNGIGASLGTWIAGTFVINENVFAPGLDAVQQLAGWRQSWFEFAAYALVVAVLFMLVFHPRKEAAPTERAIDEAEDIADDAI